MGLTNSGYSLASEKQFSGSSKQRKVKEKKSKSHVPEPTNRASTFIYPVLLSRLINI